MKKVKKKVVNITLVVIIILIIIVICSFIFMNSQKLKVEFSNNINIPLNSKAYNIDFIQVKNGTIVSDKELIDTSKLGKQNISIEIKDFYNKISTHSYSLNIIDDEKPTIEFSNLLTTEVGKEIDLLKNVHVTDNSNEDITPTVEGEYDIKTPGEYNLYYVAQDSSGNTTKESFTLKVEAKKESTPINNNNNSNSNSNNSNNNNSNNNNNNSNNNSNNSSNNSNSNNTTNNSEVHFTTSKGFKGVTKNGITYIDGYLVVNKTYSLPKNYVPSNTYGNPTSTSTTQCATCIEKTAYDKWIEMQSAAALEGLSLKIVSGYRSYTLQSNLYNNYVKRSGKTAADTFSARPGFSEHQSGLAFDINYPGDSFNNTSEAKWLAKNSYKYGYILRYPQGKSNETGYKYESWHYRYVGTDLAYKLYNNGDWITMEAYFGITSEYQE